MQKNGAFLLKRIFARVYINKIRETETKGERENKSERERNTNKCRIGDDDHRLEKGSSTVSLDYPVGDWEFYSLYMCKRSGSRLDGLEGILWVFFYICLYMYTQIHCIIRVL